MSSKKSKNDKMTFFGNLFGRRFSEAEKALGVVKENSFGNADFKEGYVNALEGLLLSYRSGDERDFLNRAPFDKKSMQKYKKENGVHSPFDVGFFLAWSDLVQYRLNTEKKG
jgi:hypothetical protein